MNQEMLYIAIIILILFLMYVYKKKCDEDYYLSIIQSTQQQYMFKNFQNQNYLQYQGPQPYTNIYSCYPYNNNYYNPYKTPVNQNTAKLYNNGTGAASITTDSNSDQFLYFIVTVKHPGMTNSVTNVMIPASQSTSNVTHGVQWIDTPQGYTKILGGTITYKYNTSNTNYTFSVTAAAQAIQAGSSSVAVTGTAVITRVMGFGLLVLGDFA